MPAGRRGRTPILPAPRGLRAGSRRPAGPGRRRAAASASVVARDRTRWSAEVGGHRAQSAAGAESADNAWRTAASGEPRRLPVGSGHGTDDRDGRCDYRRRAGRPVRRVRIGHAEAALRADRCALGSGRAVHGAVSRKSRSTTSRRIPRSMPARWFGAGAADRAVRRPSPARAAGGAAERRARATSRSGPMPGTRSAPGPS